MTKKEKHLADELCREVEERYPEATVVDKIPVPEGGVVLLVLTPIEGHEIRINEEMAQRSLNILFEEGIYIGVSAHYEDMKTEALT